MAWYEVLGLVLGIVGSLFGIFGVSAYINERMKHKADKKNQKEDADEQKAKEEAQKIKDMEEKQLLEKFRAIVREENAPLSAKLETLENSLKLNTEGTVTILRSDMNRIKTELEERGYATDSEKGNWKQLYTTYGDLGGNHFKEYVDEWKTSIEKLPPAKKIRRNKSKTIITEGSK